jgi:hypothetical protein
MIKTLKRFCDWMDMFRANLLIGFIFGLTLVVITSKANYYGYVRHLPDNSVGPLVIYVMLVVVSFVGFVHYLMVNDQRNGISGFMGGVLASCPLLFIGLWYSARLAHIALS